MRSSIACIRCRRSKVKCVNNGVGTLCKSCEASGRDCSYPAPVTPGVRRRDSVPGRQDGSGDGDRRQRPRKSNHTFVANPSSGSRESPRPLLDALDPRLLTPTVWQELFDIFQIHYSADLPFLHPPTFLKPLRTVNKPQSSTLSTPAEANSAARPPQPPEFLLAFLALTARFHPKLVAHHSPTTSARTSNPLIASDYYAAAANERLSGNWNDNHIQDIERCQSMLMLGLHEWGMCRGARAWLMVGAAIRTAQAIGLQYELDLDDEPLSRSLALNVEAERLGINGVKPESYDGKDEGEAFIQQEIRRRTFWSCFIMDRYLSSGKYRPQMLHAKELRIQLPASERSFMFAEKVRTLMLGEEENVVAGRAEVQHNRRASVMLGTSPEIKGRSSPNNVEMQETVEDKAPIESGAEEGLVSRYIKVLELYGKVVKWSCAGGRRTEQHPPWDPRCEFYQLRKQCTDFKASLPRQHTLTPQNTQAHISLKTSTPYLLVHTVYLLCQIMLHREYVPFIPIRCSKPEGPLDPPMFPPDKIDVPENFWEDSARECFKAARDVMDLVRSCQEWSALVETPIVGFAIYTVAFVGVYCINFPWMDPNGYMCTRLSASDQKLDTSKPGESKGFEAARKALEMIGLMRPTLKMADGWFKTINRMHKYFRRMKSDYRRNITAAESTTSESDGSPLSARQLSLREGGFGGGLDEFKLLERTLKEFGNLEDQDVEMEDVPHAPNSRPLDAIYDDSHSGTTVKSEDVDNRTAPPSSDPPRTESGGWNAINSVTGASSSRHGSISTPNSGHFRSYESYQQPQQTAPSAPQQQSYQQQPNSFRPVYSQDSGAPPSLTSPASHSATTPSQPSPSFDRQQSYHGWPQQQNASSYQMQPPQGTPYTNGVQTQHAQHQMPTPIQTGAAYQTPHQHAHIQVPIPQIQEVHQPWNAVEKEAWLNNLDTRLGGDDFAAFVDGGDMAEWATMAANRGYGAGWLSAVWGGPGGNGQL